MEVGCVYSRSVQGDYCGGARPQTRVRAWRRADAGRGRRAWCGGIIVAGGLQASRTWASLPRLAGKGKGPAAVRGSKRAWTDGAPREPALPVWVWPSGVWAGGYVHCRGERPDGAAPTPPLGLPACDNQPASLSSAGAASQRHSTPSRDVASPVRVPTFLSLPA